MEHHPVPLSVIGTATRGLPSRNGAKAVSEDSAKCPLSAKCSPEYGGMPTQMRQDAR